MPDELKVIDNQFHVKEFYELKGQVTAFRELFEFQLGALREIIEANFKAIALSTDKALAANDRRLEGMNEFRQSLKDQAATFITRKDFDAQHERVKEDIQKLEISRAEMDAKADQKGVDTKFLAQQKSTNRLFIVAVVAIAISLLAMAVDYFKVPKIVYVPQPKIEQTK